MRRYRRPLVLVIFVLVALYFVVPLLQHEVRSWLQRYQIAGSQTLSDSVSSSLVYPIKTGQWLTFNIPENTQQLRIISNAHIVKPDSLAVDDNWKYILRYQLLDSNGKIIMDDLYHHRSRLTSYHDQQAGMFFGNFYSGHQLTPLDGRLMMLAMAAIKQTTAVRISLVRQNHEVEETAIRLYVPAQESEHSLASRWLRMSSKRRDMLAKHSVYPATLLSATEKSNLLKHQWQAVGPTGVEGKNYVSRTLYILKEMEQEERAEAIIAAGLQLDAQHLGVIAIPEQGGNLTLKLKQLNGSPINKPTALQLNWFGPGREQRWQQQVQWIPGKSGLNYHLQGGLLQLKTFDSLIAHAFLSTDNQQNFEITPKPLMITGYLASQGVDYQVLHVQDQPSSMRIDIRRIYQQHIIASQAEIEYQLFNEQQQLVNGGTLPVNSFISSYDRLTGKQNDLNISDPVSYYLKIPNAVTQIKLVSKDSDLLVNAYNQPYQFRKSRRVPESSYVSLDKKDWFPAWFRLRPDNEQALLKQHLVSKINVQYRPPEDDLALLAKQYMWEDYRPLEPTEARFILTALPATAYRDQALARVYCTFDANQLHQIKLKAYAKLSPLSAELMYIRPHKNAFNVSVFVDKKLILDMPAIGQQGAFKLPKLAQGIHQIKVLTKDSGQWFLNHVSACSSPAYLKRRVFKLKNRQLTFLFKNDQSKERVFSGRYYTAPGISTRSVFDVDIEPLHKHPTKLLQEKWTYLRRRYDIRPPQGENTIVLQSHGHFLNPGESFFIPFNSDMPLGQYRIKMTLRQGTPGYLSLTQVQPGAYEQRRFYKETND